MAFTNNLTAPFFGPSAAWGWRPPFFARTEEESDYAPPAYPQIYDMVRARLQKSVSQLPNSDPLLVMATAALVAQKVRQYKCVEIAGGYDALTGEDRYYFDAGVASYVAAEIRPQMVVAGTIGGGILVREKLGDDEWQYATPQQTLQQPNAPNIEDVWRSEGDARFALISCVAQTDAERAAVLPSLFDLGGPSRARRERCGYPRRNCW